MIVIETNQAYARRLQNIPSSLSSTIDTLKTAQNLEKSAMEHQYDDHLFENEEQSDETFRTFEDDLNENEGGDQDASADFPRPLEIAVDKNDSSSSSKEESVDDKQLMLAIRYLRALDDAHLILASKYGVESLKLLCRQLSKRLKFKFIKMIIEQNLHLIVIKLVEFLNQRYLEDLSSRFGQPMATDELKKCFNKCLLLRKLLFVVMRLTNYSASFCTKYLEGRGLKDLVSISNSKILVEAVVNNSDVFDASQPLHQKLRLILKRMLRTAVGVLHNLSKFSAKFKQEWVDLRVLDIVADLGEKINNQEYMAVTHMIMAQIAEDEQINKLPKLQLVVQEIVRLIDKMSSQLLGATTTNHKLERHRFQLNDEEEAQRTVFWISDGRICWSLVELVDALYHLAVNDNIKHDIYFKHCMNKHLRAFIYNGNSTERSYAVKLLWQLCFDDRVAADVRSDDELVDFVECLLEDCHKNKTDSDLLNNCQGINWLLQKSKHSEASERQQSGPCSVKSDRQQHIMISYNRDSRDLCLSIKEQLEKMGYRVQIDVENIHGSALDWMAKAVEESFCVLICMTEKYKQSNNCRSEAEYVFQLNKPIVPLIMQENYKPDGWLGFILGSKIFVNFTKYSFEECMRRLKHEIEHFDPSTKVIKPKEPKEESTTAPVSEAQVEAWFVAKRLSPKILDSLRPCDGRVLEQLSQMLDRAPEFFYNSLSMSAQVNLREVSLFAFELAALYKK